MSKDEDREKPYVGLVILALSMISIIMFGSVIFIVKNKEFFKQFLVPQ